MGKAEAEIGGEPRRLHYLSVPPAADRSLIQLISDAKLVELLRMAPSDAMSFTGPPLDVQRATLVGKNPASAKPQAAISQKSHAGRRLPAGSCGAARRTMSRSRITRGGIVLSPFRSRSACKSQR